MGPRPPAADLVLLVEDVELANLGQEASVVDHLTCALMEALAEPGWTTHPQIRGLLATRAALLLARPMTEAWFFDGGRLPPTLHFSEPTPSPLTSHPAAEDFEAADLNWSATSTPPPMDHPHNPGGRGRHHAERYLQHLAHTCRGSYGKMRQGVSTLKQFDLAAATVEPTHNPWLRSIAALLQAAAQGDFATAVTLPIGTRHLLRNV